MSDHRIDAIAAIEHVFQAWDEALGAKDLEASMALYHSDATLESPLVCHLLGTEEGVVRGKEALRSIAARLRPPAAQAPPLPDRISHRRTPPDLGISS